MNYFFFAFITASNVFLVVDPQGYDYLIPNSGIVGLRLMFHEKKQSLWPLLQDAVFIGTKFQTLIRLTGVRQVSLRFATARKSRRLTSCLACGLAFDVRLRRGCSEGSIVTASV